MWLISHTQKANWTPKMSKLTNSINKNPSLFGVKRDVVSLDEQLFVSLTVLFFVKDHI